MTPVETLLTRALLWATAGAAVAVPALILPAPQDPFVPIVLHLGLGVAYALGMAFHVAPLGDTPWFAGLAMADAGRRALTGVTMIAVITGAIGSVLLATGIAMRYDASVQFLLIGSGQAITAIAVLAVVGARRRFGGRIAAGIGIVLGGACVAAIARYLDLVGFGTDGTLVADGDRFAGTVLPVVGICAVVALWSFSAVARGEAE